MAHSHLWDILLPCLVLCWQSASGRTNSPAREYSSDLRSDLFFRPTRVKIDDLGLVNDAHVYLSTQQKILEMVQLPPTPAFQSVPQVTGSDTITASFLCHHRSSIFYEVDNAGQGSIFELDILHKQEPHRILEIPVDREPGFALACVDGSLLRLSKADFMVIDLSSGQFTVLLAYGGLSDPNFIASLSVRYAADRVDQAEIYTVFPRNKTIARLKLQLGNPSDTPHLGGVNLLAGGNGADGVLAKASVREPHSILSSHGQVFFTDGCAVRVVQRGVVKTLLGDPSVSDCVASHDESLELAPWSSTLARPAKLAGSSAATAHPVVLLLTEAEQPPPGHDYGPSSPNSIIRLDLVESACASFSDEKQCIVNGCAWAEGRINSQRLCFECDYMRQWAAAESRRLSSHFDGCSLQVKRRAGTRYALSSCGCHHSPNSGGSSGGGFWQAFWLFIGLIGASAAIVLCCLRQGGARAVQIGNLGVLRQPLNPPHAQQPDGDIMAEFEEFVDSQASSGTGFGRGN
mmetsp:Transcript_45895/g.106699  ORF Transcript_45895/g.106699 Transcript_45895/m.106699 type:complete len:517 (+) Transcript_45895:64-1614(+)